MEDCSIDECGFIDVLEEAVLTRGLVHIELSGGGSFTDRVRDVVTTDGKNFAVLHTHGTIPIRSMLICRRA